MNFTRIALATLACIGLSAPAAALDFTMNFDEIPVATPAPPVPDQTFGSAVFGYYNSDPVYDRAGKQPWDTTFSADTLAICSYPQAQGDCQGEFPNAHSGVSAAGTISSTSFSFEISPGLVVSKLSFWYNAGGTGSNPAVKLFSDGNVIFTLALEECSATGGFCGWKSFTVPGANLDGQLITKVGFFSTPNKAVFDDVSVSTSPIPEPSTYAFMLAGLAIVAAAIRRRTR